MTTTAQLTTLQSFFENRWGIDQLDDGVCPSRYAVITTLGCPDWCELPRDHDADSHISRVHRAALFTIPDRAEISVAEIIFHDDAFNAPHIEIDAYIHGAFSNDEAEQIWRALRTAFAKRDDILAEIVEDVR